MEEITEHACFLAEAPIETIEDVDDIPATIETLENVIDRLRSRWEETLGSRG